MEVAATKASFQKHPAYKDSGVEWLGEIPEGWKIKKLKFLGKIYPGLNGKKGDDFSKEYRPEMKPFIPFTNIYNNFKIDKAKYQFVKVADSELQNRVKKFDLLFLMSSETIEDIGKCSLYDGEDSELYLNSFCKGFRLTSVEAYPYFINYLLKGEAYRKYFSITGRGFTRINIKQEYVNDLVIPIPSLLEQTAIAAFLDDKTAKIDRVITQKQQMIALLKERRQIIIQNAVTGKTNCLNHDSNDEHENYDSSKIKAHHKISNNHNSRPMKDSGVEWIGEIPEGWESTRLGYHMDILSGYAFPSNGFSNEGVKLLRGINVGVDSIRWNETVFWPKTKIKGLESYFLKVGDIVVGMDRPLIGKGMRVSIVQEQDLPCMLLQRVTRLKAINNLSQFFLGLLLQNQDFVNYFLPILSGVSVPHISPSQIQDYPIVLPSKTEQEHIVSFVIEQSTKIDQAITLQHTQIKKLKEYKATLIDSAVTGKIKIG